jgi:predicted nuclease with TOPRIM domain
MNKLNVVSYILNFIFLAVIGFLVWYGLSTGADFEERINKLKATVAEFERPVESFESGLEESRTDREGFEQNNTEVGKSINDLQGIEHQLEEARRKDESGIIDAEKSLEELESGLEWAINFMEENED